MGFIISLKLFNKLRLLFQILVLDKYIKDQLEISSIITLLLKFNKQMQEHKRELIILLQSIFTKKAKKHKEKIKIKKELLFFLIFIAFNETMF